MLQARRLLAIELLTFSLSAQLLRNSPITTIGMGGDNIGAHGDTCIRPCRHDMSGRSPHGISRYSTSGTWCRSLHPIGLP